MQLSEEKSFPELGEDQPDSSFLDGRDNSLTHAFKKWWKGEGCDNMNYGWFPLFLWLNIDLGFQEPFWTHKERKTAS